MLVYSQFIFEGINLKYLFEVYFEQIIVNEPLQEGR